MAQQEPDRAEGRLRARGRVRHVEMDTKIRNVWSEIPVPVDSGDTRFTLLVNSPQFPLDLGRRHCTQLFQEVHCILPGDLCRARGALLPKSSACVLPTENKCQDRLGTALRGAHSQHGKY